jgi:transcriptional regulator with PAS, ATPase and Fis domain
MYLEDLGSVNGTRVKNQVVKQGEKIPITAGDTISIGACVLIIQHRATGRPPLLRPETLRDDRAYSVPVSVPQDEAMRRIQQLAERAAAGTINVLVTGETGVGKELLSETVHRLSPRKEGPYVCLNCAALSETLLESELFGHERGAFTGAVQAKAGLLETAVGGSLFLDEVGELPLATQAKLLRVIETRQVSRLGSLKPRLIDVRFIAATNRNLELEVERGAFRRDLYFRLNGITLTIPPLRERVSEIPHLAEIFVRKICRELGRPEPFLPPSVIALLEGYPWPGNIRELKNMMERAVLLCTGNTIGAEHLPPERLTGTANASGSVPIAAASSASSSSSSSSSHSSPSYFSGAVPERALTVGQVSERRRMLDALNACAGNQSRAAKMLGISRRNFVSKLDTYRIPRPKKSLED